MITKNIHKINRVNRNEDLMFHYQLISLASKKIEPLMLPGFKIKLIKETKLCNLDLRQT